MEINKQLHDMQMQLEQLQSQCKVKDADIQRLTPEIPKSQKEVKKLKNIRDKEKDNCTINNLMKKNKDLKRQSRTLRGLNFEVKTELHKLDSAKTTTDRQEKTSKKAQRQYNWYIMKQ